MNRKGFTLVELLATLVVLALALGITSTSVVAIIRSSRQKGEDVLVESIKDAMEIYLSGLVTAPEDMAKLSFGTLKTCTYTKGDGTTVSKKYAVAKASFDEVVNSKYKPIAVNQIINSSNDKKSCVPSGGLSAIEVNIYRTENRIYFYKIEKEAFNNCFNNLSKDASGNIIVTDKKNYISNLEEPGKFSC